MTKIITVNELLKHPFTQAVMDAFQHLDFVKDISDTNNALRFFEGYSLGDFANGNISYEEYFVRNLFTKVENVEVDGVDPDSLTEAKFIAFLDEQEHTQAKVAAVLSSIDQNRTSDVGRVLWYARTEIHKLLSDFCEWRIKPRYTSGSTLTLSKAQGTSPFERYKVSEGAMHLQKLAQRREAEGKTRVSFTDLYQPMSKGTEDFYTLLWMVPKTWKARRIIGRNATVPLALQAGAGDFMVSRLKKRWHVDITKSQDIHKRLARLASLVDSHLMTADQSEASDRVLRVLCAFLLPEELFEYLCDITPTTLKMFDGSMRHTNMMAPAGNGYIFPLQTIIFMALAKAICHLMGVKKEVYCYGDDLICPTAIYSRLERVFNLLGLKINPNKTFRDNNVRESCGGDYVLGSDVRPLYVNKVPTTVSEWYSVINGIRRVGFDNNLGYWRTNNFKRLWLWSINALKAKQRLFAPIHYGDAAIGTSDARLYKLSYKTTYRWGDSIRKYPNGGLKQGHPYSGWYIEILVPYSTGRGETWLEQTNGIKLSTVLRLTSLDSVKGSGDRLRSFKYAKNGDKLKKPISKFVFSPFFLRDDYAISRMSVPLTLVGSAPSEVDDLFRHLAGNPICDTDQIMTNYESRRNDLYVRMLVALHSRATYLRSIAEQVEEISLNF